MLRATAVLFIAVFTVVLFSCGVDDEPTSPSQEVTDEQPTVASSADDVTAAAGHGCSVVDFCDKPKSSDGTVCRQLGCSLTTAEAECTTESPNVCTVVSPWVFVATNGARHVHNAHCGFRQFCGGRCCDATATLCGTGGQCCDGIHCTSGCPC
jgi:hypothetical protein